MSALRVLHPDARIGSAVRIGVRVHVREGAMIGAGCVLGDGVFVDQGVVLGERCVIGDQVSLYHGVNLGDEVQVGPQAVFTNDRVPRAFDVGWSVVPTRVDSGACIGANATIVCGVRIGAGAVIEAGSVVTKDVPAGTRVAGVPARTVGSGEEMP